MNSFFSWAKAIVEHPVNVFCAVLCVSFGCSYDFAVQEDQEHEQVSDSGLDDDTGTGSDDLPQALGCSMGTGKYDSITGLCWQHPEAPDSYQWQKAVDYCDNLTLGGQSDWSLPSRQDFIDLLGGCDTEVIGGGNGWCNSCDISPKCSDLFLSDKSQYWSSSRGGEYLACYANFGGGGLLYNGTGFVYSVRCVSSGL